jgi:hypothetical protein
LATLLIVAGLATAWMLFARRPPAATTAVAPAATRSDVSQGVTPGRATAAPGVQVLEALRPESGGMLVRVQLTLGGRAERSVAGAEAFALLRRDGNDEAPVESRPIFDTLQPGTPRVFELRFRSADGVALRTTLPDTPPVETRLPPAR